MSDPALRPRYADGFAPLNPIAPAITRLIIEAREDATDPGLGGRILPTLLDDSLAQNWRQMT